MDISKLSQASGSIFSFPSCLHPANIAFPSPPTFFHILPRPFFPSSYSLLTCHDLCVRLFSWQIDPFAVQDKNGGTAAEKIHIRVQQRNGRKCITTIQGLADDLDIKKITRAIKKTYQCNGSVNADDEHGEIAQFSGDQRSNCQKFLVEQEICHADQIVIHGG